MRVRNFAKFQHFKDRRPPWIKLYRELLDDMDWHALSGDDSKVLLMLWLLASEDQTKKGMLPCTKTIAFRLRISETKVKQSLTNLKKWLIQDDIDVISERYQDDLPETETETETDHVHFDKFWALYPKKSAKKPAERAWNRLTQKARTEALAALPGFPFSPDKQFVPLPASWINAERWTDEPTKINGEDFIDYGV